MVDDAGAEAEAAADVRVGQRDVAARGDVPKNLGVAVVEGVRCIIRQRKQTALSSTGASGQAQRMRRLASRAMESRRTSEAPEGASLNTYSGA